MDYEEVLRVLKEAGASEGLVGRVRKLINLCEAGVVSSLDLYYYVIGLAREEFIPLTPRHVGRIMSALEIVEAA